MCVHDKMFSIPTTKLRDKLVEEGKIWEMYIGIAETNLLLQIKSKDYFTQLAMFCFLKIPVQGTSLCLAVLVMAD